MGHQLDPVRVVARGSVIGSTKSDRLQAESLDVTLRRDLDEKIAVRRANAKTNIRYIGKNRTTANADTLDADGESEQITLLGSPTSPARVTQGGSTITGDHIDLNARNRSLHVPGPGTFDHDVALDDPQNPNANGHLRVRWDGSLRFDDALGTIICEEGVTAISTPDAYTKDTVDAHRVEIDISPMPNAEPMRGQPMPERELLAARAYGRILAGNQPEPAKIESRTYAIDDPERAIGLLYLEGPQIFANNTQQTLSIPAPGTLLVMDRDESSGSDSPIGSAGPGMTRFDWKGRMDLDRNAGRASLTKDIVVSHKSLRDGQRMTVTCDELVAGFELGSQSGTTNRLTSAEAIGSVIFSAQTKQMLADNARYNAIDETVFASGEGNTLVTLHDNNQPAPVSARTMLWDLRRDRVEINAPSPVHTPSGP